MGPDRRDALAMVALVAALAVVTIAWGERIGVNGGVGWDGQAYAAWAIDFPGEVLGRGVNAFQSQRVVPSAVMYYAMAALGVAHTRAHVIVGFQLLDAAALLATVVLLWRCGRALAWSRPAAWAAFAALFASFAAARNALYYPTLTDPTALVLGAALMWAYLERRPIAIAVVALLAAGTWPTMMMLALAALVLPRTREPLPAPGGRWIPAAAIAAGVAAAAIGVVWLRTGLHHPYNPKFIAIAHRELFAVTIACCAATLAAGAYFVARERRTWAVVAYARRLGWWQTALAVAASIAIVVLGAWWVRRVGTRGPGVTIRDFRAVWAQCALRGPLWGAVHHVVYFGPIVLIAIAAWPRIAAVVAGWGPAAVAMAAMLLGLSISTESRTMSHLFAFLVIAAIEATRDRWTARRVVVFAAVALVWSKLWWRIGYDVPHDAWGWPDQRFTMHQGPWASDETFLAHLAGAVVTGAVLWLVLRRPTERR